MILVSFGDDFGMILGSFFTLARIPPTLVKSIRMNPLRRILAPCLHDSSKARRAHGPRGLVWEGPVGLNAEGPFGALWARLGEGGPLGPFGERGALWACLGEGATPRYFQIGLFKPRLVARQA